MFYTLDLFDYNNYNQSINNDYFVQFVSPAFVTGMSIVTAYQPGSNSNAEQTQLGKNFSCGSSLLLETSDDLFESDCYKDNNANFTDRYSKKDHYYDSGKKRNHESSSRKKRPYFHKEDDNPRSKERRTKYESVLKTVI